MPSRVDLVALGALGALCGLSPSRLRHLFMHDVGVSTRAYLLWLKMSRAAELFAETESITRVAAEIGFADAAHLDRVFRRYWAVAPSWLRKRDEVRINVCHTPGAAAMF